MVWTIFIIVANSPASFASAVRYGPDILRPVGRDFAGFSPVPLVRSVSSAPRSARFGLVDNFTL